MNDKGSTPPPAPDNASNPPHSPGNAIPGPSLPTFDGFGFFLPLSSFFPPPSFFTSKLEMPPELQTMHNKAKSYFSQNRQTALAANFQISILRANMQPI